MMSNASGVRFQQLFHAHAVDVTFPVVFDVVHEGAHQIDAASSYA
jgi:hypothetical protein